MDRLIRTSVEHRGFVVVLGLLLASAGLWSLPGLSLRARSDLDGLRVTLRTPALTFTAREVEELITAPLQNACSPLPEVLGTQTRSEPELSRLTLVFPPDTGSRRARELAEACASEARSHLPSEAGETAVRVRGPGSAGAPPGSGEGLAPAMDPALRAGLVALAQSAFLVVTVLLLLLGHLRSGLLVALLLPWTLLGSFLVFRLAGLSLDRITLAGLVLALGLIADASVILVENAVRLLGRPGAASQDRRGLIVQAAREVKGPVMVSGGAILMVFLPLPWLPGLDGMQLAPLARSVAITLACSLVLCLTLLPALACGLLKPAPIFGSSRISHPGELVRRTYRPHLAWAMQHPRAVLGLAGAVLIIAAVVAPTLGAGGGRPTGLALPRFLALGFGLLAAVALMASLYLRHLAAVTVSLVGVPLALAGGVLGLKLSGLPPSAAAQAGFLALIGIATLPALVMIGGFRTLEADGRPRGQAVRLGAELRLRAIFTTAATTGVGLAPLLWTRAGGWDLLRPLAVVIVSGVVISTLLTVMTVPVLYRRAVRR